MIGPGFKPSDTSYSLRYVLCRNDHYPRAVGRPLFKGRIHLFYPTLPLLFVFLIKSTASSTDLIIFTTIRMADSNVTNFIGISLGLLFFTAGARKLCGWEWARASYLRHHPLWVYHLSAIVEVIAGPGLAIGRTRFYAAILQLLLIIGVSIHPWKVVEVKAMGPAVISTSLLIYLVYVTYWRERGHRGRYEYEQSYILSWLI